MKTQLITVFAFLLLPLQVLAQADKPEQVAIGVGQSWLALVDEGDYAQSWDSAAVLFQNTVDKQKWEQVAKDMRSVGPVIGRSLKSATYTRSMPNAPAGEYVEILFDSEFEKQKSAVEKVVTTRGDDGTWRVTGYYLQ